MSNVAQMRECVIVVEASIITERYIDTIDYVAGVTTMWKGTELWAYPLRLSRASVL